MAQGPLSVNSAVEGRIVHSQEFNDLRFPPLGVFASPEVCAAIDGAGSKNHAQFLCPPPDPIADGDGVLGRIDVSAIGNR